MLIPKDKKAYAIFKDIMKEVLPNTTINTRTYYIHVRYFVFKYMSEYGCGMWTKDSLRGIQISITDPITHKNIIRRVFIGIDADGSLFIDTNKIKRKMYELSVIYKAQKNRLDKMDEDN